MKPCCERTRFSTIALRAAVCAGCAVLLLASGCKKQVTVDPQESVRAVNAADSQWSKAAAAHDLEAVMSYYADGATVMPPHQEMASNKPSIRKLWAGLLVPETSVTWTPGNAEVSNSGDVVYDEGFYIATTKVAKGKPVIDRGKYLAIWKKQPDGNWKAVASTWNSDLPIPAAPKKK
jgi:ketosteroid isomerase-like protein